jgi:5-methylcytosine-specific restriction endonuclease McrA
VYRISLQIHGWVCNTSYPHTGNSNLTIALRRFYNERRKLIEMHGPRCTYCHQYFLDSEFSVDHIVSRALYSKSIAIS